jgi:hypothetical protein
MRFLKGVFNHMPWWSQDADDKKEAHSQEAVSNAKMAASDARSVIASYKEATNAIMEARRKNAKVNC